MKILDFTEKLIGEDFMQKMFFFILGSIKGIHSSGKRFTQKNIDWKKMIVFQ